MQLERQRNVLPRYEIGLSVMWFEEPVGVVTGHDMERGRVLTSRGGDYNPLELIIVSPDKVQRGA